MDTNDIVLQALIVIGVAIGNAGATYVPFIWEKNKFKTFDITIFFDKKFLGTAAISFISSIVVIGMGFNAINAQVMAKDPVTLEMAFIAALGVGFSSNLGINWALPPSNTEARAQLEEKKTKDAIAWHEFNKQISQGGAINYTKLTGENNKSPVK